MAALMVMVLMGLMVLMVPMVLSYVPFFGAGSPDGPQAGVEAPQLKDARAHKRDETTTTYKSPSQRSLSV